MALRFRPPRLIAPGLFAFILASGLWLSGAVPAAAQPNPDVMGLVRADRWADADFAAAAYADPVVAKLVTYYRLLAPAMVAPGVPFQGAAAADEITAFMRTSPDWPLQATLARRRDDALALEPDDEVAAAACDRLSPQSPAALLRCAEAYGRVGRAADFIAAGRRAWVASAGDLAGETRVLQRFGPALTAAEQWERFERLTWTDATAAARQAARLDPSDRPRAEAWLALRRDDPNAPALLAALPAAQRTMPALVLEQARALRRAGQDDAALALWTHDGAAAEAVVPPEHRSIFWGERNLLARRLLRAGDAAGAYALADDQSGLSGEPMLDAEFLAGFIALEKLHDPAAATPHFNALAAASKSAITQGRAHYWLARAAAAGNDSQTASREYNASAAWPNTFYGQLSMLAMSRDPKSGSPALAARIAATGDPPADATRALDLAGRELARAAAYLVSWGEQRRAQAFLLRLDDVTPDPADRALAARLATGLGVPETAVAIARRAGRDGVVLLDTGWPIAVALSPAAPVEPALTLGIIRQESSFDSSTISPVGARGLMQLMPATAGQVAHKLGLIPSVPALVLDPGFNMRLGTAYLGDLLTQFGGVVPFAVAGYNAGPARVREWIAANGDPTRATAPTDAMIDWIEQIPFGETRNYVQRVIENEVIYRAKAHSDGVHPLVAPLTQSAGLR